MVKTFSSLEEIRWYYFSKEVDKFDLRKLYDRRRYAVRQALKKIEENPNVEEREVREGSIIRILQIKNISYTGRYGASYCLENVA